MDIETLRLEREEKRRQRRERIRKILDDDPAATGRTREQTDSTRSTQNATTTTTTTARRARENITTPTTTERTRYSHRDHGDASEVRSARSTRTTRMRQDIPSSSSTRAQLHTSDESTPRTTSARGLREYRTSSPTEQTISRSERTNRASHIPVVSSRTTRSARPTADATADASVTDSLRARREARRKRNQEHDAKQNKITVENRKVDVATKSKKLGSSRTARDRKVTDDKGSQIDKHKKGDDSEVVEKNDGKKDISAKKDTEDTVGASSDDTLNKLSECSQKESKIQEDIIDELAAEENHETEENDLKVDNIENLDECVTIEGDVAEAENAEASLQMNEASSEDAYSKAKLEKGKLTRSVADDGKEDERNEKEANGNKKEADGNEKEADGNEKEVDWCEKEAVGIEKEADGNEKEEHEVKQVIELDHETEVEPGESVVDEKSKETEESSETVVVQGAKRVDDDEILEGTSISDELPKTEGEVEVEVSTSEDRQTPEVAASEEEHDVCGDIVEKALEISPLESIPVGIPTINVVDESADNETLASDKGLVILEDLPETSVVLAGDINGDISCSKTCKKTSEIEPGNEEPIIAAKDFAGSSESALGDVSQGSEKEPDEVTVEQKIASPHSSPRKTKLSTTSGAADTKVGKSRQKSSVSRTKSDESQTKTDRLKTKSSVSRTKSAEVEVKVHEDEMNENESVGKIEVTRTKSAESGGKDSEDGPTTTEAGAKAMGVGKLKVGDEGWKKNVRKKRGITDVDRAVELTVLGRTGKIKNKMKSCEARDVETAEQWKKEVKTGPRKHKSFDEETEKELRELSAKRELKNVVEACEEKDKESAEAWKREVKKDARKHKSLDADTENELREISKTSLLKSRIKDCEKKDKESADAWKKEVKKEDKPKDPEVDPGLSEDLKEFSGSGRLKDLISSCSERDENKDKSWESAKEKVKSVEDEDELQELASLSKEKSKIVQQYEEMEKQSAESALKKLKSGERVKSFDETTDEELLELAKTVDVKTRIQSTMEEKKNQKETAKQNDHLKNEELKEINLKARLEVFKQEDDKCAAQSQAGKLPGKTLTTEGKETSGRKSPSKGSTSPTKGDAGRISPAKDRPRSLSGRVSPSKDKARTSSTIGDSSGRTSPTKERSKPMDGPTSKSNTSSTTGDSGGRLSPTKDRSRTRRDSGRISPVKDDPQAGRTSPTKRDKSNGRISPGRNETPTTKRDIKGRTSPTKDKNPPAKSKLESIRANLMDGGKNKPKSKRESLTRVAKSSNIKDKIAACKERDKAAPRTIVLPKAPSKTKPKPEPDTNALNADSINRDAGELGENETPAPVNRESEHFTTIEEEIQRGSIKGALSFWNDPTAETKSEVTAEETPDVDIRGKMTYWESPKDGEDTTKGRDSPSKDSERAPPVILGNVKQGWQKRNRKLKVSEFIKELLGSNCKRRDLKNIEDVKSETKKYLKGGMHAEEARADAGKTHVADEKKTLNEVELENRKNTKKDVQKSIDKKDDDEFSLDDVVNPDEVKQLRDFSNFRRQVRPTNRRAAKSNPVRKLQQRDDVKTGTESFNDVDVEEDEEDASLKPTAIGRLGRAIEPGDKKSNGVNIFAADALAGLAAKEDASKITLKKTSKSRAGVSQEKSEYDGTLPVMLLQIKGHRHMQTRLVEPSVESLNSSDSFLLVTEKYLHVWNGKDSNVMKKSKASELSNKILQYKLMNCNATVATIIKDGGVNIDTALTRTFWSTLGGKKTVKGNKEVPKDGDYETAVVSSNVVYSVDTSSEPATLHKMSELCGKIPKVNMLDSDKAFVFDFGTEVYAWLGRTCEKGTRTKAVDLALEVYKSPFEVHNSLNPITPNMSKDDDESRQLKRPSWALFGRMTERAETILFEQKFLDWPDVAQKMKMDKEKDLLNKNLSKGYAKRIAKIEKSEYQAVELVPYDGAKMGEEPPPVKLILEGVNVGRGRGSFDEIERRGLTVTTNSVTVYHSSEKESRQLEEKEWGHFYSGESYVIRWSYSVKASGIRSLKGGESKRDTTGRDQIAYFFWHGRDCSASGKGTSALATIELDSDKSPQIMVDEGHESACFLNMFDGQMTVHHGKLDEAKSVDDDNVLMYCVHHEDEREICLNQIEARSSNLRSRSSFVVIVIDEAIGICVWHGAKSIKEKRDGALRGAKRLAAWFQGIFDIKKVDMVELEEGHEGSLFWKALDGKSDYGSLLDVSGPCDNRVRLFSFLSTEGPFLAREILNPTRGEHVSPYPFRQANLFDATQPALFLVDAVREMYLWQGWWPGNTEESESATTTGSAEFRWHRDRKLAMQSVQSYADSVGRQMSKAYVVNAGLEPIEFRALFPFWEDYPDVTKINLESGKGDGEKESMTELLAKLSRDRYTLAELLVRPLPEGVDPAKIEMYLSDEEFKEVFNLTKDEFNKLPRWKKLEQRKKTGLF